MGDGFFVLVAKMLNRLANALTAYVERRRGKDGRV